MNGEGSAWQIPDDRVAAAVVATVLAHQGLAIDEVVVQAGSALGHAPDDPVARRTTERAVSALVDRSDLVLLAPDRVVAPVALLTGAVLTHRLTDAEVAGEHLSLACDLAPFAYCDELTTTAGTSIELVGLDDGLPAWIADAGWPPEWRAGDLLTVRLDEDGLLEVQVADPPGTTADQDADAGELAAHVRTAYDRERADPHLPALVDDIFFAVSLAAPGAFARPGLPLGDLLARAGLDHRGPLVAHDATVWQHQARADRRRRVADLAGDEAALVDVIVRVLDIADLASGAISVDVALGPLDAPLLTGALDALDDHDVLAIVSGELLRSSDLVDQRAVTRGFVAALLGAAGTSRQHAVARYLAALDAQLAGDAPAARDHLAASYAADVGYAPATDLFAYYASTAGDRPTAVQRWSECPRSPVIRAELDLLQALPTDPSLVERVPWLLRKAIGFLERSEPAREDLAEVAFARAVDPSDEAVLRATLDDPLVFDAVLQEGGWFARFLATMGPLLPADERSLLARWAERERTLFEVGPTDDDGTVHLTGTEPIAVITPGGRSHGTGPLAAGVTVCGRVVPDGDGERLAPGWFVVPGDVVDDVREILGERDPIAVALIASELDALDQAASGAIDLRDHLRVIDR